MTMNPPSTQIPREDLDFALDRLLAEWYEWRRGYKLTKGFSGSDGTCRDYRAPGHWDWQNGAAEAKSDELQMRAVDEAIEMVPNKPHPWNTAIQFEAMNVHSGAAVWRHHSLPQNLIERDALVREARNKLLIELKRRDLL